MREEKETCESFIFSDNSVHEWMFSSILTDLMSCAHLAVASVPASLGTSDVHIVFSILYLLLLLDHYFETLFVFGASI